MHVGFSVISVGRDVEFRLFSHHGGERPSLVTVEQTPHYTAVLMGRLYYRRELVATLDSPLSRDFFEPRESNAAALALAAYLRFGTDGIARLEGDFALVIWDAKTNRLLAARDPMGGYPLFWTENNGEIAFSTAMRPLLERLPRRSLNLDYVAEFLMLPSSDVQELGCESCAFEGIRRVLAGSVVNICIPGGRIEQHRFWNWLESIVDPGTDRLEVLSEQFADLLRRAVRERLCGRTAAHLSGGMDSTGVALLARDVMDDGHGKPPLHTVSLVYEQLPGLARETPHLEAVLQQQKGIAAHRVAADQLLDFDGFTDPPLHDEPWAGLPWLGTGRALVEAGAQERVTSILTGEGADQIVNVPPFYIVDALRRGRIREAWRDASQFASANTCSVWSILRPFCVISFLPAWARGGVGVFLRRGYANWKNQNEYTIAPWIRPSFARHHALRSRAIEHLHHLYSFCRPTRLSVALSTITRKNGDWMRWYVAAPQGMMIAHPFLDPRVVCFGLGVLTRFRGEPGRAKPLLAEAMRGLLPDSIRNRRRKGNFNEPYFLGLARNLPQLEALVRHAPIDDLGLFDKDILVECLHQAAQGITSASGARALSRLNLSLAFIQWFSMERERQPAVQPPTAIIHSHGCGNSPTKMHDI